MKKDLTEIVLIVDKSGSMAPYVNDTIGGINNFITEQKKVVGSANVTLIMFDTFYNKVFTKNLNEVTELTNGDYFASGSTALIDAMCRAIDETGAKLSKMNEKDRPSKVIFVTLTDGEENASHEYTNVVLKEKIKHQEERYSWQFMFLSADPKTFDVAKNTWGISHTYAYHTKDTNIAYAAVNSTMSNFRSTGKVDDSLMDATKTGSATSGNTHGSASNK